MAELGATAELEAELIKRNREIARARDDTLKAERRLEEAQLRNDALVERSADLDAKATQAALRAKELEDQVRGLEGQVESSRRELEALREDHTRELQDARSSASEAARAAAEAAGCEAREHSSAASEAERSRLQTSLDDERRQHGEARTALEQCEASLKAAATRSLDLKRRVTELEGQLREKEEAYDLAKQERDAKSAELSSLMGMWEKSQGTHHGLEAQAHEFEMQLAAARAEAEDLRHALEAAEAARARLQPGAEAAEHLEGELQAARAKVESLQEELQKAKEDAQSKVHAVSMRSAQLETELRKSHERLMEAEGRLDAQRSYVEQVNSQLGQLQGDRDTLMETKGSLEAQLRLELSSRDAAQSEVEKRCRELEERMARDRETHREALEEARRSASERSAALEAELRTKQQRVEAMEGLLASAREDAEARATEREHEGRRAEADRNELRARGEAAVERAEAAEGLARDLEAEGEALRRQISELEDRRLETEARLRAEVAIAEDEVRRLQAEAARGSAAAEDELALLRKQLDDAREDSRRLEGSLRQDQEASQRAAAERAALEVAEEKQGRGPLQLAERLAMAQEELICRQVDSALERQRLSGALEESRRALRNSFGVVRPAVASADSAARVARLETLLAEEKRKGEDQARALERAQQQSRDLAALQTAGSDAKAREAERRCTSLEEDLRKAKMAQSEAEERVKLSLEEISSLRRESSTEAAQLRGALDQLRCMLKVQPAPANGGGGYPAPLGTM